MPSQSEDADISGEGADDNISHCMLLGFGSYE